MTRMRLRRGLLWSAGVLLFLAAIVTGFAWYSSGKQRVKRALARLEQRADPWIANKLEWPVVERDAWPWLIATDEAILSWCSPEDGPGPWEGVEVPPEFDVHPTWIARGLDAQKASEMTDAQRAWFRGSVTMLGDLVDRLAEIDSFDGIDSGLHYASGSLEHLAGDETGTGTRVEYELYSCMLDAALHGEAEAFATWASRVSRLCRFRESIPPRSRDTWHAWLGHEYLLDAVLELLPLLPPGGDLEQLQREIAGLDLESTWRLGSRFNLALSMDEYEAIREQLDNAGGGTIPDPYETWETVSAVDQATLLELYEELANLVRIPYWRRDVKRAVGLFHWAEGKASGWGSSLCFWSIFHDPQITGVIDEVECKRRLALVAIETMQHGVVRGAALAAELRDPYKDQALSVMVDGARTLRVWSVGPDGLTGNDDDIVWISGE